MAGALVSGLSGPGSSPCRGRHGVFLCKTANSHSASLYPDVYMGTGEIQLAVTLRQTSILTMWEQKCSRFRLAPCYGHQDKLRPDRPVGQYADFLVFFTCYFAFLVTGPSSIYRIIVIALSCIVFVLLVAVGVLTWRLTRALMNKREKPQERSTSYGVDQLETPRDQHMSQGDEYLEPLEVMPPATSHYQSLHTNNTSAKYGNAVSNNETDNSQEDELYLTIIP